MTRPRRPGLPAFALLLLLGACVSRDAREATRLLEDIDAGPAPSALKAATPEPRRDTVAFSGATRSVPADLYVPGAPIGARLVLVPGFTPQGKDDPRVVDLATSLARARFLVLVPDLDGSRAGRVRLEDAADIADGARYLAGRADLPAPPGVGIVAVSYAVGLAIRAALQPDLLGKLSFLVGIGAYFDAHDVIAYMTTGRYRDGPGEPWRTGRPYPTAKWIFLASNLEGLSDPADRAVFAEIADHRSERPEAPIDDLVRRLGPEGRRLLAVIENTDPEQVTRLIGALPAALRARIDALSPSRRDLAPLAGRLVLIHGRDDRLIPYTESVALARAAGRADLFLIDGFSHIEPRDVGLIGKLELIDAIAAVLARRQ